MPAERRLTSAELRRKTNKPIMEKKRRERINKCLEELKSIVLRSVSEESRPNKLEKADILEMTVRYLRNMKHSTNMDNEKGTPFSNPSRFGQQARQEYQNTSIKCEYIGYPQLKERRDSRFAPYQRPVRNSTHMLSSNRDNFGPQQPIPMPTLAFNIPGKYSPIPVSPISSASSKSPTPSGSDSTFEELDVSCRFRPIENSVSAYSCQVVPSTNFRNPHSPPVESPVWPSMSSNASTLSNGNRTWSPENSRDSSIEFSTAQSYDLCSKSEEFIWRPWGVAS